MLRRQKAISKKISTTTPNAHLSSQQPSKSNASFEEILKHSTTIRYSFANGEPEIQLSPSDALPSTSDNMDDIQDHDPEIDVVFYTATHIQIYRTLTLNLTELHEPQLKAKALQSNRGMTDAHVFYEMTLIGGTLDGEKHLSSVLTLWKSQLPELKRLNFKNFSFQASADFSALRMILNETKALEHLKFENVRLTETQANALLDTLMRIKDQNPNLWSLSIDATAAPSLDKQSHLSTLVGSIKNRQESNHSKPTTQRERTIKKELENGIDDFQKTMLADLFEMNLSTGEVSTQSQPTPWSLNLEYTPRPMSLMSLQSRPASMLDNSRPVSYLDSRPMPTSILSRPGSTIESRPMSRVNSGFLTPNTSRTPRAGFSYAPSSPGSFLAEPSSPEHTSRYSQCELMFLEFETRIALYEQSKKASETELSNAVRSRSNSNVLIASTQAATTPHNNASLEHEMTTHAPIGSQRKLKAGSS